MSSGACYFHFLDLKNGVRKVQEHSPQPWRSFWGQSSPPSLAPAETVAQGHLLTHLPSDNVSRTRELGHPLSDLLSSEF